MPRNLVSDSSSLCALERVNLIHFLEKIPYTVLVPSAVQSEMLKGKSGKFPPYLQVAELRGKTLKKSRDLELFGIGIGEAQCCALAASLKLNFIVCDDQKFLRQKIFSRNVYFKEMVIFGFSFFLHEFYKNQLVDTLWLWFDKIIEKNNWKHSYVEAANYTFLKERGY